MAIRKVSDLERLYLREEVERDNDDQISNMLFEVSWPDAIGSKSFISKHMTYQDIVENILVDNLLCSETLVDFYAPITFHNGISVYNGERISGDFFVNRDVEDDILERFQTLIRNGNNTIQSVGDGEGGIGMTMLCSQYINVLSAGADNVLCARNNVIKGNEINVIRSSTQDLAWFTDNLIYLRSNTGSLKLDFINVSCDLKGIFNLNGTLVNTGDAWFGGWTHFANVIDGCALCAQWADLAEHYASDADYAPGTLVQFGGDKEITVATTRANAVITTTPGLILNGHAGKDFKAIALVGRTPVRVVGEVKKFDRLTLSDVPGVARSCTSDSEIALGVALEANSSQEEKLVLAAVQMFV